MLLGKRSEQAEKDKDVVQIEPLGDEWNKRLRSPLDWGPVPGKPWFYFLSKADPTISGQFQNHLWMGIKSLLLS